jgi:RNA polymerase sigma-70 factor (ECF subfamily)
LNTCYDQLRRHKARPEVRFADLSDADVEFVETVMTESHQSEQSGPDCDGRGVVEKLLATLNPRERMVLQLMDLEKKSLREVCALTGWGLSKVKVTAMRARRKLNGNLKQLEGGLES